MIFIRKRDNGLEDEVKALKERIAHLEHDLIHDPLTRLKTREYLEGELRTHLAAIERRNNGEQRRESLGFSCLSVIFFDIDHFKEVNDAYGHEAGDLVLKKVAETIATSIRAEDTASRWGGEEFVVALLGACERDAVGRAEEIRKAIEKLSFTQYPDLKITISGGVSEAKSGDPLELVKRADQALYKAKNEGRNRVVSFSSLATLV